MRLISVYVHGLGRFDHESEMRISNKIVAIVGPNEAGKTSFLRGLSRITQGGEFSPAELTRRTDPPADLEVVHAKFLLEDADRALLSDVHGGETVRWFMVGRRRDGQRFTGVAPAPVRDLVPRSVTRRQLETFAAGPSVGDGEDVPVPPTELIDAARNVLTDLESDDEVLDSETLQNLRELASSLTAGGYAELGNLVGSLVEHESGETPFDTARGILANRVPSFLMFGDEDRNLSSTYDLDQVSGAPPAALRNLVLLANLDLASLLNALNQQDFGRAEELEQRANKRLREVFRGAWKQAGISVRLRVDGRTVHVLVETEDESYSSIAERSDGLRAFVALIAFVSAHSPASTQPPILLIDEAETHLHYDAQADLVRMFEAQTIVSNIIYSTHSAGCLPEDLGSGVRVIAPSDTPERSVVRNWLWENAPGFPHCFLQWVPAHSPFPARAVPLLPRG